MTLDVDLYTALLGGEVQVPTLDGRSVMLRIPPGTQNGGRFRLRQKGMPVLGRPDEYGDLQVVVSVRLPSHLSDHELKLYTELRELRARK